ncbi:MAG: hypothetical protein U0441_33985 [Polyangiaceae bacterium]
MLRAFVISVSALAITMGCTPTFKDRRTPSGDFCSDMAIIPAGEEPNLEYHRLTPVQSDIKARTEAERLESLRKAACLVGADAVIEAVNEETRNEQAQYVLVSSGTAVIWVRPKGSEPVPLTTHKKASPDGTATPATTSEPAPTSAPTSAPVATATPTAAPTAAPVATATPTATPSSAPTASPTAAPTSTGKSKLPTNAAPKPIKPKK